MAFKLTFVSTFYVTKGVGCTWDTELYTEGEWYIVTMEGPINVNCHKYIATIDRRVNSKCHVTISRCIYKVHDFYKHFTIFISQMYSF